jgi:hypothetical protein
LEGVLKPLTLEAASTTPAIAKEENFIVTVSKGVTLHFLFRKIVNLMDPTAPIDALR